MQKKPKRIINKELLEKVRNQPCIISDCRKFPSDPAHVISVGAGGHDIENNVTPLCHKHHVEQHTIGILTFTKKYPDFRKWLEKYDRWDILNKTEDILL